ncbi:MAG: hypothetical protein A3J69_02810 [Candidatus Levybacteria bacterium RIFCSPHIGHO2_02_FULL_42_12]|nr:MAG: hypothetical protein A3J69_02810 [Candidatus Levybacteria bacterium RIFCSPHIGHO2_02_FULL_42_12]
MDERQEEKPNEGPVSKSINTFNNLGSAFRTARDAQSLIKGTRAAAASIRVAAAAASTPVGWIVIVVVAVVILLVFIIAFSQGTDEKDFAFIPPPTTPVASPPPTSSSPTPGEQLPNSETCDGIYTSDLKKLPETLRRNFGDPSCTMRKNPTILTNTLRQHDPKNASKWIIIASCESDYSPNAYNPRSTSGTAWGLFQMGRGLNGIYDHGDVEWNLQTTNAINYNNTLINSNIGFEYWACAFTYGFAVQ